MSDIYKFSQLKIQQVESTLTYTLRHCLYSSGQSMCSEEANTIF